MRDCAIRNADCLRVRKTALRQAQTERPHDARIVRYAGDIVVAGCVKSGSGVVMPHNIVSLPMVLYARILIYVLQLWIMSEFYEHQTAR